jgi:DNA-binding transcriptional MerR regulator
MRISELSRRSGVPVATIKYYMREGLLPAGEQTAINQAIYDDGHLARIELIRVLREGADLSIATIARVLTAMDDYRAGERPDHISAAICALSEPVEIGDDERHVHEGAAQDVSTLLAELGWNVDADSPGRDDLAAALVTVRRHLPGLAADHSALLPYAVAVRRLADVEIPERFDPASDPAAVLRFSVLGTVLFEPVLLALRKLAHVDRIRRLPASTWASRAH